MFKVFISYAHGDERSQLASRALSDSLRKNGYDVWLDTERLRLGDRWREELAEHLVKSSAGVLLLSAPALESEFVLIEAAVLSQKSLANREFKLLILTLDDLDTSKLECSRFKELRLTDIQYVGAEPEGIAKLVLEVLEPFKDRWTPRKGEARLIRDLATRLGKFRPEALIDLARDLELDLYPGAAEAEMADALAIHMVRSRLVVVAERLCDCAIGADVSEESVLGMLKLMKPFMIDSLIADGVDAVTRPRPPEFAAGFTANSFESALLALQRATGSLSPFKLGSIPDAAVGERVDSQIKYEVLRQLEDMFYTEGPIGVLEQLGTAEDLVIIALPHDVGPQLLRDLQAQWPRVLFFIVNRSHTLKTVLAATGLVRIVEPQLEEEKERQVDRTCAAAKAAIRSKFKQINQ